MGLELSPLRPLGAGGNRASVTRGGARKLTYNSHDEKPVGATGGSASAGATSWGDELVAQGLSPATAAHSYRKYHK